MRDMNSKRGQIIAQFGLSNKNFAIKGLFVCDFSVLEHYLDIKPFLIRYKYQGSAAVRLRENNLLEFLKPAKKSKPDANKKFKNYLNLFKFDASSRLAYGCQALTNTNVPADNFS